MCDERRVGLEWAGEEDECVGWGGESLFVAARPQSCGLDAVGRCGVEESEGGKKASFSKYRLFDVSLVPCDGAGIVRKRSCGGST